VVSRVYFHLADSIVKSDISNKRTPEALPYFQKVLDEFKTGEWVEKTQQRLQELEKLKIQ